MKIQNTHTCLLSALLSILLPFCSWYQNLYFLVDFHLWSMQSVLGFISRLTSKNVYPGPSRLSFLYICGVRLLRLHTVAKTYNVGVIFCNILSRGTDTFLDQRPRQNDIHVWKSAVTYSRKLSSFYYLDSIPFISKLRMRFAMCHGTLKADSHIACRSHAVPLPCRTAKGLKCAFPI